MKVIVSFPYLFVHTYRSCSCTRFRSSYDSTEPSHTHCNRTTETDPLFTLDFLCTFICLVCCSPFGWNLYCIGTQFDMHNFLSLSLARFLLVALFLVCAERKMSQCACIFILIKYLVFLCVFVNVYTSLCTCSASIFIRNFIL